MGRDKAFEGKKLSYSHIPRKDEKHKILVFSLNLVAFIRLILCIFAAHNLLNKHLFKSHAISNKGRL